MTSVAERVGLRLAVAMLAIGVGGLIAISVWLIGSVTGDEQEDRQQSQVIEQLQADAQTNRKAAEALAAQVERRGGTPVVDPDDLPSGEIDDPDPNDPEVQDAETQDPEIQEAEVQDPDPDDPEVQDPELPDGETDDPDPDDPENQDPEIQDPEVDDPDPNSRLEFVADDSCSPPDGQWITGADLTVVRTPDTVTYVLVCTSATLPQLLGL